MSALAINNKSNEKIHYSGTQFKGLENVGNHHLCVRTGIGTNDVVRYGLTTTPLSDKYKALRIRLSNNTGGSKIVGIAQRYSVSNVLTATRISTHNPIYYGRIFTSSTSATAMNRTANMSIPKGKYITASSALNTVSPMYANCTYRSGKISYNIYTVTKTQTSLVSQYTTTASKITNNANV